MSKTFLSVLSGILFYAVINKIIMLMSVFVLNVFIYLLVEMNLIDP